MRPARLLQRRVMPLYLTADYARYIAERIINRLGIGKNFSNIRIQNHHIAAFFASSDIFASDTLAEIVFLKHIRVTGNFLIHMLRTFARPFAVIIVKSITYRFP
jgi:hypothetical protein